MREMLRENLPPDWNYDNIKNIGEVVTGNTPKSNNSKFYCENGVLWASPADLGKGKYINKTNKQLSKLGFDTTRKLPPLSIMITCIGSTIGKIGMTNSWMATNQQINSIICNKNHFAEFYYYVMEYMAKYIKSLAGTQAVPLLNKTDFSAINVPIPPLPEQQKIAHILSTVDAKIEVIDQQITENQELKKGLMQRLLTKGIGHTQFKDSALGLIPMDWEVVKLGKVLKLGGGKDYKHLEKGNIPVYGTGGIITYVNEYLYDGKSVGIGRKGSIDKPVFLNGKFWTVDTLFYTHSFDNVIPFFMYVVFQSIPWRNYSEATGVPSLSRSIIEPIKIAKPPIEEQQKIADILSSVDEKLDVLSGKKTTYLELKKGLMQQLLTGKVRVRV